MGKNVFFRKISFKKTNKRMGGLFIAIILMIFIFLQISLATHGETIDLDLNLYFGIDIKSGELKNETGSVVSDSSYTLNDIELNDGYRFEKDDELDQNILCGPDKGSLIIDNLNLQSLNNQFTVETYIKIPSSISEYDVFQFFDQNINLVGLSGATYFGAGKYNAGDADVFVANKLPTDKWIHVVATAKNGVQILYVNGKRFSSANFTGLNISSSNNDKLILGNSTGERSGLIKFACFRVYTDYVNAVMAKEMYMKIVNYNIPGPVLTCLDQTITSINQGEELYIPYQFKDELSTYKITLYYKTTEEGEYKFIDYTSFPTAGKYAVHIPADELLNCKFVDYYLEAFNEDASSKTDVKRIKINHIDDFTGIRTNLSENEIISGEKIIIAKDKNDNNIKVSIDDKELTKTSILEKGAFFTISYTDNDKYCKNAVSVGDDILTIFSNWAGTLQSKVMLVDSSKFIYNDDGTAEVTLTVWAGTHGSAFEIGTAANNDNYKATGMKLILTDGTVLTSDNGIDPNKVYKMGDSAGMYEKLDVHFTIPADKVDACSYVWNTKSVSDGSCTIKLTSSSETKTINVVTDNTAPEISVNIIENDEIKGKFNTLFDITDANEVNNDSLEVYLDDTEFESPYSFIGSNLFEGNHTITVKVSDKYGNNAEKTIHFTTKNGYTIIDSTNEEKLEDGSIRLVGTLGENTDSTNVTFYEGIKYGIGNGINVYSGAGDSAENCISDTLGTVTSQTAQYPYQVFEITTEGTDDDTLQIAFESSVSYELPVSAYVYNYSIDGWEKLSLTESDGINTAEFTLAGKVNNNIVKVMIQARETESMPQTTVPQNNTVKNNYIWDGISVPQQYDFSFSWITDTQYYVQTYIDNFKAMNEWIVENKDELDIKYVIHTGDLVDDYNWDFEWKRADEYMKIFDNAGLPYGVLAGNHDIASGNESYTNYWKYFGEDRFTNSDVYGESYKNNLGHYDLLTIDGQKIIVLYMSWDIYTDEINWMNEVLGKYSDRKAIICLHRYINEDGILDYTGNLLQEKVIAKNPNVFAVLNGHYHGAAINIIGFDDDNDGVKERNVYQICTDYQGAPEGGSCYIKMIYFDLQNNKVYMNSYSPTLNDYNFFDDEKLYSYTEGVIKYNLDIYELDVDFSQPKRSLTTNSFDANLYTTKKINDSNKQDNKYTSIWTGLVNGEKYGWYICAENEYGLKSRSKINEFEYDYSVIVTPTPTISEKIRGELNDTNSGLVQIANTSNNEFSIINCEANLSIITDAQKNILQNMTDEQIQAEIQKVIDAISTISTNEITDKAKEKIDLVKKILPADARILPINFTADAQFAFPVQVTISLDQTIYPAGTYYLYYINEETDMVESCGIVTVETTGIATFTISHCSDYFISSNVVNLTELDDNPKTGDSNSIEILLIIAILSAASFVGISQKRKFLCKG